MAGLNPSTYSDTIRVLNSFPGGSIINWSWPAQRPTLSGVWGYDALSYGNYDGGSPQVAVTPRQVNSINVFTEAFDYAISGELANFGVLNEFYLTNTSGNSLDKKLEIGFLLHPTATTIAFQSGGTSIGTYTDAGGISWSVVQNSTFVTFMRLDNSDVTVATIDKKAALLYLKGKGVITGSEWVNGCAIGIEPFQGVGRMQINKWVVTLN